MQHYWYGYPTQEGKKYNLIVEGTFSIWSASFWTDPCGHQELTVRYPSKDGDKDGQGGFDMEYNFARPNADKCTGFGPPLRYKGIEISTDGGKTWKHPNNTEPFNDKHVYNYVLDGGGNSRLGVRHTSAQNSDDYGRLRFIMQPQPCDTPQIFLGNDTTLCTGQNLWLTTKYKNADYKWGDGSDQDSFLVTEPGKYWVTVETNCFFDVDTINVDYVDLPTQFLGADTILCKGDELMLQLDIADESVEWQDGSTNDNFLVQSGGTYSATIKKAKCESYDEKIVRDFDVPNFDLGEDLYLCTGEEADIFVDGELFEVTWYNGEQVNQQTISETGLYWVDVTNPCGPGSDSIRVFTSNCDCKGYIPSAFTPNNDGINNLFKPTYTCEIKSFQMQVFNRWGDKVFESNDYINSWDGKLNGEYLENGTYMYRAIVVFKNKRRLIQSGVVNLLR